MQKLEEQPLENILRMLLEVPNHNYFVFALAKSRI
jgi:hypothetical protein